MHQLKSSLKSPGIRALNLADFVCTRSSTLTRWTRDSTDIPLAVHGHSGGTEGTWASFNPPPKAQGPQPNPTLEDPTSQFIGEGSLPDGRRSSTHHLRHGTSPWVVVSKQGLPSAYLEAGHLAGAPQPYSPISSSPCCSLPG